MSQFSDFIPYLNKFDYPNIAYASEEYIEEIFSAGNRQFLLNWLIKLLNSEFIVPIEWSQSTQNIVAGFFEYSGFCSPSEKLKFVTKDSTLSKTLEIAIFTTIFQYLQTTIQKSSEEVLDDGMSTNDLEEIINEKINLFPNLKAVKLRSKPEIQLKIDQLKSEIAKIKEHIRSSSRRDLNIEELSYEIPNVGIAEKINKIKSQAVNLEAAAKAIENKATLWKNSSNEANFGTDLADLDCKTNQVLKVLKYFENVNAVNKVSQLSENEKYQNELNKITYELAKNCNEIKEIKLN